VMEFFMVLTIINFVLLVAAIAVYGAFKHNLLTLYDGLKDHCRYMDKRIIDLERRHDIKEG
jgi:hypothetical protein